MKLRFTTEYLALSTCDGYEISSIWLKVSVDPIDLTIKDLIGIKRISLECAFVDNSIVINDYRSNQFYILNDKFRPDGVLDEDIALCCAYFGHISFNFTNGVRELSNSRKIEALYHFCGKLQNAGFCISATQLLVDSISASSDETQRDILSEFKLYDGRDADVQRSVRSIVYSLVCWRARRSTLVLFDGISQKRQAKVESNANDIMKALDTRDTSLISTVCDSIKSRDEMISVLECIVQGDKTRLVDWLWGLELNPDPEVEDDIACMGELAKSWKKFDLNPIHRFKLKGGAEEGLEIDDLSVPGA